MPDEGGPRHRRRGDGDLPHHDHGLLCSTHPRPPTEPTIDERPGVDSELRSRGRREIAVDGTRRDRPMWTLTFSRSVAQAAPLRPTRRTALPRRSRLPAAALREDDGLEELVIGGRRLVGAWRV